MTVSLCIRQESKRNDDSVRVEELDWSDFNLCSHKTIRMILIGIIVFLAGPEGFMHPCIFSSYATWFV